MKEPRTIAYLALAGVLCALMCVPFWAVSMPPLTDFGAHVTMAEVWSNYDENPLYRAWFQLSWGTPPNLMAVRFAWALSWAVDALTALRLWMTLCVLGTAAGMAWVLSAFDRSRWLLFLVLPLVWGDPVSIGLVNYAAAIPMCFAGLALGRRAGVDGLTTRRALAIAALGVIAYLTHAIGCVFVLFLIALGWLSAQTRLPTRRDITRLALALAPGSLMWLIWFLLRPKSAGGGLSWHGLRRIREDAIAWNYNVTANDAWDTAIYAALFGLWLVLMLGSAMREGRPQAPPSGPGWARRIWAALTARPLLMVALGLAAAILVLPETVGEVAISTRLLTPFLAVVLMLPRGRMTAWWARAALAAAVLLCAAFGALLWENARAYQEGEMEPLEALLEQIPEGSVVGCVGIHHTVRPFFVHVPLTHGCHGLTQFRTRGISGAAFANTGYNALRFQDTMTYMRFENRWEITAEVLRLDYLIARGGTQPPRSPVFELVDAIPPRYEGGGTWRLFRVAPPAEPSPASPLVGGSEGRPAWYVCGENAVPRQLGLSLNAKGVRMIQPGCQPVSRGRRGLTLTGSPKRDLALGAGPVMAPSPMLTCPARTPIPVGLHGAAGAGEEGRLETVGLICADGSGRRLRHIQRHGQEELGGEDFELRCPPGHLMDGVVGRAGDMIDAVGLSCRREPSWPEHR